MINYRKINLNAFGITRAYAGAISVARKRATWFMVSFRAGYFSNFSNYNILVA